jgi:stage V sporulation protein S
MRREDEELALLKVSSKTDAKKLARAIYHELRKNGGEAVLQAIGAGAVNQAVKGVAIARGLAAPEGYDLKVVPGMAEVKMGDGVEKTAVKFRVFW